MTPVSYTHLDVYKRQGVRFAAGEAPEQIRIDRAEGEFAARGKIAAAFCVLQQPRELGAGEIRICLLYTSRCV